MRIELEKLDETGGKFSRRYQTDDLKFDEHDLTLIEPVTVNGRIRRKGLEVELHGHLRTKVAVACGRCLKSVELLVEVEFTERFTPAVTWKDEEQHELSETDLDLARQHVLGSVGRVAGEDAAEGVAFDVGVQVVAAEIVVIEDVERLESQL